jgi:uncharacterized membrane protein
MVLATFQDGFYDLFLFLHLTAAIVGFGGVLLNAVYGARARAASTPLEGAAIVDANFFVSTKVAEKAIYAVPLFGFGLIGLSDSVWSFSDFWIWGSIVLYVCGLGIAHGVLVPTQRSMIGYLRETPPNGPAMEAADKKLALFGPLSQLIFVAIMVLMIWKPGN